MKDDPGQQPLFDGIEIDERTIRKTRKVGYCDCRKAKVELVAISPMSALCKRRFDLYETARANGRGIPVD